MSRLTFPQEFLERNDVKDCIFLKPALLKEWDAKLRLYENLGEPEELVKVLRCEACNYFAPPSSDGGGRCLELHIDVCSTDFCSNGHPKEV